jgi:putative SOS response-associated peptidase YedK
MCGRYAATADPATLAAELDAVDETVELDEPLRPEERGPNYNVAPTTKVLTVVRRHDHDEHADLRTRIRRMRWGLIPPWTKPAGPGVPAKGKPLFNARADRAATTQAFRGSLAKRRCLVPMDGWYEWQVEASEHGKAVKVPYYLTPSDGSRLYLAGLWSVWRDGPAQPVLSCTILTTDAIGEPRRIHDRMPLIMPRAHWDAWLDPDHPAPAGLLAAADPDAVAGLRLRQVSTAVNSVKNNDPSLLRPVEEVTAYSNVSSIPGIAH